MNPRDFITHGGSLAALACAAPSAVMQGVNGMDVMTGISDTGFHF